MKLDLVVADWLDDVAAWWLSELGPAGEVLSLPIPEHFTSREPARVFERVRQLGDMIDGWSFELVDESDVVMGDPLAHMPRPAGPATVLAADDDPIGEGEPLPVAYTRELAAQPALLIASFARDLSHYLLYAATEEPPVEEEHRQVVVEVGAVMMGFGVFLANAALTFQQVDTGGLHGWSTWAQGELGEDALGYLLAVFVELRAIDPKIPLAHLTPNPRAAFKWAHEQLRGPRREVVERLRSIAPASRDGAPYR